MPPKRRAAASSKAAPKRNKKKDESSDEDSMEEDNISSSEEDVKTSKQEAESDEEDQEEEEEEEEVIGDPFDIKNAKTLALKGKHDLQWKKCGTLYFLESPQIKGSSKIIGFDMDSTLVVPKGKGKFPKDRKDWKWMEGFKIPEKLKELHKDGYKIIIFSNQAGIEGGQQKDSDICGKILDLCDELGFPIQAFLASAKLDVFRKPNPAMWKFMLQHCNEGVEPDLSQCMYVGDAAGRAKNWKPKAPKDFSCTDRSFACNLKIDFKTPEEFFLKEDAAPFEWGSIDPKKLLEDLESAKVNFDVDTLTSEKPELVILTGCPASGKSTFARKYFVPKGYVHINQDTLKTKAKCVKACEEALKQGKSVVVDNTNPGASVRKEYTSLAAKLKIPFKCVLLNTDLELAHHLNFFREKIKGVRRIPDVGYNMFKKNFQTPSDDEGFTSIIKVNWIPDFENDEHKAIFLERTA